MHAVLLSCSLCYNINILHARQHCYISAICCPAQHSVAVPYLWKESTAAWVPQGSCAILSAMRLAASCTCSIPGSHYGCALAAIHAIGSPNSSSEDSAMSGCGLPLQIPSLQAR